MNFKNLKKILILFPLLFSACGGGGGGGGSHNGKGSYSGKWVVFAPNIYNYCTGSLAVDISGDGALDWDIEIEQNGNNITYKQYFEYGDGPEVHYGTLNDKNGFTIYEPKYNSACSGSHETYIEVTNINKNSGHYVYIDNIYCPRYKCYSKYEGTITRK